MSNSTESPQDQTDDKNQPAGQTPSEFIGRMKEVVQHIRSAQNLMSNGPLEYYFEKLVHHSDALLSRFAPVRRGQRAVIIKHIECRDGWSGCEKTLAIGQVGEVVSVDYDRGKFWLSFVPDEQWYMHGGLWMSVSRKSSYCLAEDYLKAL